MKKSDFLNVFYETTIVGRLWQNELGKIIFQYDSEWLDVGFAISLQLPLQAEVFSAESNLAHRFFANLLPEEGAREQIIRDLKISDTDYSLLKAIGGECAGALSILPTDMLFSQPDEYKEFSHEELKQLLLRKGNVTSFVNAENRPRLSLAGAHAKCPIRYEDSRYFLPIKASPSTHILKFQLSDYKNIPIYECFLSKLAEALTLPVAMTELKKLEKIQYLLIKRFDRVLADNHNIQRLHQEDFCQAMGAREKYEQYGGPSFADCVKLLKNVSTTPANDVENLLKWQIFNFLAGNSDGHAKNLALLYDKHQQLSLAPFYDLVCTRAIDRIDTKMAMSVGGEAEPSKISTQRWQEEAKRCEVRPQYLVDLVGDMANQLQNSFDKTVEIFETDYGKMPILQRARKIVLKQCKNALKATD